jgi:hypothetical protein
MSRFMRPVRIGLGLAMWALIPASAPAAAQEVPSESALLREAAALESKGDFAGAELLLDRVLEANPTSTGGLFALERVLRAQGRTVEVLAAVDAFLAQDASASGPRYLKLRILVEADSLSGLREEGLRWIELAPASPEPYREVARVYERALGPQAALEILEMGRDRTEDPAALALETGDLRLRTGDTQGAGVDWARAVGPSGEQGAAVLRRVGQLRGEREAVATSVVEELEGASPTPARRQLASQVALEGGLEEEAIGIARGLLDEMRPDDRRGFLSDLARRAEERRADPVALWAYMALRETAQAESEVRALDLRIAETALLVGDTARALEARRQAADALPEGSPERRRALAQNLRIEVRRADASPPVLADALREFKVEFPEAPELDDLAALVSVRLQAEGSMEEAAVVLQGVDGPRSALERAYLSLDGPAPVQARDDLLRSLEGLPASQATEVIALVDLLDRATPEGGMLAARATVLAHRGAPKQAAEEVELGRHSLPGADQASLLALAGRVTQRAGELAAAEELWRAVVIEFPAAPEAPEASLALARLKADSGDAGLAEAIQLLEALILTRPNSPVVPTARRELEELRAGEIGP